MENWFIITSYNQECQYGYGSEKEAERYCELISSDKAFWHATTMSDAEVAELNLGDIYCGRGFVISEAIDAIEEEADR
jgi:hypothetical protein